MRQGATLLWLWVFARLVQIAGRLVQEKVRKMMCIGVYAETRATQTLREEDEV